MLKPAATALVIFAFLLAISSKAIASYTATGQPCDLSPDPANAEILAICTGDVTITLIGDRPNKVHKVRFSSSDTNTPTQTLKLTATPLIDPETVAIMFVDFNFDGHKDFAIMPRITTSENVEYLFFLYDAKTQNFQASPEMRPIVNPEVNRSKKHIRSYWRKTPILSGWNFWVWKNNKPVIATRIEQSIKNGTTCLQTITHFTGENPVRSPPQACL